MKDCEILKNKWDVIKGVDIDRVRRDNETYIEKFCYNCICYVSYLIHHKKLS